MHDAPQLSVCFLAVSSILLLKSGRNSLLSAHISIYDDIVGRDHQYHNVKQWGLDISERWNTSKLDPNFPALDLVSYRVYLCGLLMEAGGLCASEGEEKTIIDGWPDLRK